MPVATVTGPRQSGKTMLLREAFPEFNYVNLEDPEARAYALEDPRDFLAFHGRPLIIDEAQYAPDIFSYIQVIVDEERKPGRYILSGSQNFLLAEQISQSLAGRTAVFFLLPFAVDELAGTKYEVRDYASTLFRGMYPRIYDAQLQPEEWYPSYLQTYVERDVRNLLNITDTTLFQKFMGICAGRTGQLLNTTAIGNELGITHKTVRKWLSILETSFIVFFLQPHYRNFNKRLVKRPKLYFYDTGLACSLLNIKSAAQLATHYLKGGLFESFILSELFKSSYNRGLRPSFYFWRDNTGNEVDCLYDAGIDQVPIEIKSAGTINHEFFKGLKYYNRIAGREARPSYLVYSGDRQQPRSGSTVVPWNCINDLMNSLL